MKSKHINISDEGWATLPEIAKWELITAARNAILLIISWINSSNTLTEPEREAGLDYIQTLKDIPQNFNSPDDVVFPTPPEFLEEWVNL